MTTFYYRLEVAEGIQFDSPSAATWKTDIATLELRDGSLTCRMKRQFAEMREARKEADALVRAWEIHAGLELNRPGAMGFQYVKAEGERPPVAPGEIAGVAVLVEGIDSCEAFGTASVTTVHRAYPVPPPEFRFNPDVGTLWDRLQRNVESREPLLAMGYFCLTVIEWLAKKPKPQNRNPSKKKPRRDAAAQRFNVDYDVLDILGELTSTRSDGGEGRKAEAKTPLTEKERRWILAVLKKLIYIVGEDSSTRISRKPLSMLDLPTL